MLSLKQLQKRLSDRYASTFEMSRDLMTALSYNRSRERKLVFEDTENTKTLPKVTTSTPVPSTTEQLLTKQKAAKVNREAADNKIAKAKTKKKKSHRMFGTLVKIFFAVVVVAIAIFTYLTLSTPASVNVPDVAGTSYKLLRQVLHQQDLKLEGPREFIVILFQVVRLLRLIRKLAHLRKKVPKLTFMCQKEHQALR